MSAFELHKWIHEQLQVDDGKVTMVQIDGPKRQVFIKFREPTYAKAIVQRTTGSVNCKPSNGEISNVQFDMAGLGKKRVRIANLPPEIKTEIISVALAPYGEVKDIQGEQWSKAYRYAVSNGVRIVYIILKQHLPSHLTIAGHRSLISYEGQPSTCYRFYDTGHMYQGCPKRKNTGNTGFREPGKTCADVVGDEDVTQLREERNRQTTLRPTIEWNAHINDNRSQGHGTETEGGKTTSDFIRNRRDDGSDGTDSVQTEGHSLPETAEELEAVTGITSELAEEKRREKGRKDSLTGPKQPQNTGKCPSGGGGGQLSTKATSSDTVTQVPAMGAGSFRSKKQRLDKSAEQLTDWKRTCTRGAQTSTDRL
jgi:hypothetical protein